MNNCDETIGLDIKFELTMIIYELLKPTIMNGIEKVTAKTFPTKKDEVLDRNIVLEKVLSINLDRIDDYFYIVEGKKGIIYAVGDWLIRPIFYEKKMIPMMYVLEKKIKESQVLKSKEIIFIPNKKGIDIRKEQWFTHSNNYDSYDIPQFAKLKDPLRTDDTSFYSKMMPKRMGPPPIFMLFFHIAFFLQSLIRRLKK